MSSLNMVPAVTPNICLKYVSMIFMRGWIMHRRRSCGLSDFKSVLLQYQNGRGANHDRQVTQ